MNRVAITGAGIVSPIGASLAEFHAALADARSGIRPLPADVTAGSGVAVGALIDWDPSRWLAPGEASSTDRGTQFAIAAATQALDTSRFDLDASDRDRIGVYWGTGMGGAHTLDASYRNLYGANT